MGTKITHQEADAKLGDMFGRMGSSDSSIYVSAACAGEPLVKAAIALGLNESFIEAAKVTGTDSCGFAASGNFIYNKTEAGIQHFGR